MENEEDELTKRFWTAHQFIQAFEVMANQYHAFPHPEIRFGIVSNGAVKPDSGIAIEWNTDFCFLSVWIAPDGSTGRAAGEWKDKSHSINVHWRGRISSKPNYEIKLDIWKFLLPTLSPIMKKPVKGEKSDGPRRNFKQDVPRPPESQIHEHDYEFREFVTDAAGVRLKKYFCRTCNLSKTVTPRDNP
jgi:hypothetical protein